MFKTITIRSVENLQLNMDKNIKIGSGISSTNRPAKNLSSLVDIAEDAEVGKTEGSDNKTVKKSPSKKLSGPRRYLTSLHFGKR